MHCGAVPLESPDFPCTQQTKRAMFPATIFGLALVLLLVSIGNSLAEVPRTPSSTSSSSGVRDSSSRIVVAKDGSGNFVTITDALNSIGSTPGRITVYVKAGVYEEYVTVRRPDITLVGDGIGKTVITSSRSDDGHVPVNASGAMNALGSGFIATDISFTNTAGPQNGPAVALRVDGNFSAFHRCSFEGYQDTLFVNVGIQFFRDCTVLGTIDFIFGDAAVVFQNCIIAVRKPIHGQENVITAQGREVQSGGTGIVIHNCTLTTAPDFDPSQAKSYLGRPWRMYSRTVVMQSSIGGFIDPAGWIQMEGSAYVSTLTYREFANTGDGAGTDQRVKWPGYRVMGQAEAMQYTVAQFIQGQSWIPQTGIPFSPSLI